MPSPFWALAKVKLACETLALLDAREYANCSIRILGPSARHLAEKITSPAGNHAFTFLGLSQGRASLRDLCPARC